MPAKLAKWSKGSRTKKSVPPIIFDDSPITVGGGGGGDEGGGGRASKRAALVPVYVLFKNYRDYPTAVTGVKKKKLFERQAPVKTLIVSINHILYNLSAWIPADGKGCSLKVECQDNDWNIDMYIEHAGIKFHTGKYPPEDQNEHSCDDRDNFINKITFKTPIPPKKFEWKDLTAMDEVSVYVDTM